MRALRTALVVLLAPSSIVAQQVPSAPLKPTDATLKAGFSNVHSMHELSDGRVLLSDMMASLVGVGNMATGKFEAIPNLNPGIAVALAGDSTLMFGLQPQWVFLVGARPIGMLPSTNPVFIATEGFLSGADSLGYVLATRDHRAGMPTTHGDSTAIVRVARTTAEQDTLGWLGVDPRPEPTRQSDQGRIFHTYEQVRLALDGWVAVLRANPYRVDWRTPDGRWILGAPIPVPVVKLDDREKLAYMVRRARGAKPESPATLTNWPDVVPPWTIGYEPIASSDGKLVVLRTPTANFPDTRYDVINRRGELERQVTMAANEKILGFGAKSVYVTVTARDGGQSVDRHPWP